MAPAACADLRFFEERHSLEGVYVRSLRAGRAQAFGGTTIGARSYMEAEWVRCVWHRLGAGGKWTRGPMTEADRAKGKGLLFGDADADAGGSGSVLCLRHGRRVVRDIHGWGWVEGAIRQRRGPWTRLGCFREGFMSGVVRGCDDEVKRQQSDAVWTLIGVFRRLGLIETS